MKLARKYRRIIGRTWLVIRIPNALVPALCDLMECRHDHPRRIAMQFIRDGIKRSHERRRGSNYRFP